MGGGAIGTNGAFGENIGFALKVPLVIQNLQRTEQEIPIVVPETQRCGPAVDETMMVLISVIQPVQSCLQAQDFFLRLIVQLGVDQIAGGVPQFDQAADPFLLCGTGAAFPHQGAFPVVDSVISDGVAVIPDRGVSVNGLSLPGILLRQQNLRLGECGVQIAQRRIQAGFQRFGIVLKGQAGGGGTIRPADHLHGSANHFGVVHEVLIHGNAVRILPKMEPWFIPVQNGIALLQKYNVRGGFGARRFEGDVGKAHCANQVAAGGKIAAYLAGLLIHRPAGGQKRQNAARTKFVHGLCKEIIMDLEMQTVVLGVIDLKISKRNIAHHTIEEVVGQAGLLKTGDLDVGVLVELFRKTSRQGIQFHAVQVGVIDGKTLRSIGKEGANAHAWFQNVALLHPEALQSAVHGANDFGRCVKGGEGTAAGVGVFCFGQEFLQLSIFLGPCAFLRVKNIRQTAPAGVFCQNGLFLRTGRRSAIGNTLFDFFQQADSGHIGCIFLPWGRRRVRVSRGCIIDWLMRRQFGQTGNLHLF